jgi:Fe-S-cluster containining protein
LNQFLTPYDIVRLKQRLGMSSHRFLKHYTIQQTGPETGLPIIILRADRDRKLKCPFVAFSGCSVYEDRPSSCRTYPLARAASRSRETNTITEQYVLLKEPHCLGFEQGRTWTVREWIKDQDIFSYNEMNDMLLEIIGLKKRLLPGPLDIKSRFSFYMALYDVDTFRSHIFEQNIFDEWNLDEKTFDTLKNDDVEVLKLGHRWVKKILFGHYR